MLGILYITQILVDTSSGQNSLKHCIKIHSHACDNGHTCHLKNASTSKIREAELNFSIEDNFKLF